MAKSKRSKKSKSEQLSETLRLRIICICFIFLIIIAAMRLGIIGEGIDFTFCFLFGNFNGVIYFILLLLLGYILYGATLPHFTGPLAIGGYLVLIALLTVAAAPSDKEIKGVLVLQQYLGNAEILKGGVIGAIFFSVFSFLFDRTGAFIAAAVLGMIGLVLIGSKSYIKWLRPKKRKAVSKPKVNENQEEDQQKTSFIDFFSKKKSSSKLFFPEHVFDDRFKKDVSSEDHVTLNDMEDNDTPMEDVHFQIHEEQKMDHDIKELDMIPVEKEEKDIVQEEPTSPKEEVKPSKEVKINKNYRLPPLSLLKNAVNKKNGNARAVALDNAKKLTSVLKEFGVNATVHDIFIGPAVTKYEIKIETGVRVNRIVSLQDDIKLALAAKDIRIEAPIPGKSAIGIEIPNLEASTVSFKEVFKDIPENKKESKLLVPLGKDITGHSIYAEINKMPHLLIAGATGSGKSVCVNTIICSILMRAKPDEVKLLLVDPKKVELTGYNGIPHLVGPVVTDPKKAAAALRKVVEEMERRYELFAKTNARNIEGYNEHAKTFNETCSSEEKMEILPYYVVILDEVADLMMVASKEVEDCIMRISQMARAAGMHLIVATQRPSADVITGVIKANIPSRIAFAVSSSIDSRTILDASGAEKLLGRGDMLFSPIGASHPTRIQGAFVSDDEVSALVHYVMGQQEASYDENFVNLKSVSSTSSSYEEEDEEYEMCRDFVIREQKASASLLQRQFRIGYNKAARIIDQLEANGVIGPQLGSKPREVLIRGYHEEDL